MTRAESSWPLMAGLVADRRLYAVEGLLQRAGFGVVLLWIFLVALGTLRLVMEEEKP